MNPCFKSSRKSDSAPRRPRPNFFYRIFALTPLCLLGALNSFAADRSTIESASATPDVSLKNGNFEKGETHPDGWRIQPGGIWSTGTAHAGERFLNGRSKTEAVICASSDILPRQGMEYRLEGWVRCSSGYARLGIDFLDDNGRIILNKSSARQLADKEWRYIAIEVNAGNAVRARVGFNVKGEADLDDVGFGLLQTSFIGNPGLEADDRGRIPFWGEEKDDSVFPGKRAGKFAPDTVVKRTGKSSGSVISTGDWFGVASVNYPLAAWTERYELSVWAKCDRSATAQILACWMDDYQRIVRVDSGATTKSEDWSRLSVSLTAPTNAASVRLVAVAQGGQVRFDDADLLRLAPHERRLRIFSNQIGYDLAGPKSLVVAANFFPKNNSTVTLQLRTLRGKNVLKQKSFCSGRIYSGTDEDWGWYFWRVDFTSWSQAGSFNADAQIEDTSATSAPFSIDRGLLLTRTAQSAVDFFFIQRCGFEVPGWHKACHLDDAILPDGHHLDLTGGWHSAGDYNKLMYEHGDGGVTFALLKAMESAPECFTPFDRNGDGLPDALDEAMWGARFVAKMQIPKTGALLNHLQQGPGRNWTKWSAPEVHTDNIVGTADDPVVQPGEGNSPLVIGAWARLASLLKQRGQTNDYLENALRLWNHATNGGTNAGSPYLILSSLDLQKATGRSIYLDYARRSAESLLAQQTISGRLRGAFGTFGESTAAALATFALSSSNDPLKQRINEALNNYIGFCVRQADNSFGLAKQPVGDSDQFFPPDMGNSFQVLGRAWAAALIYRVTHDSRALVFAADQLDWLLGKNPLGLCLFEGKGAFNPPRYHHRYNQIPNHERGAVPGTIPNGFVRDMGMADRPGFDLSRGGNRSPSFRTSEPWLVHNLFYLLATSELHRAERDLPNKRGR